MGSSQAGREERESSGQVATREQRKIRSASRSCKNNANKRINRLVIQGMKGWKASKLAHAKFVLTAQRFYSRPPKPDPQMMNVPLGDDDCSMTADNFNEVRRWHGPRRWGRRVAPISEDLERLQTEFEEENNDGIRKRMKSL